VIAVDVREVEPDQLLAAAAAWPDTVLICRYGKPLAAEKLADLATQLSPTGTRVEAADVRTIAYDEVAARTSTALSLDGLDPHTDGSFLPKPPARFLLSCSRPDEHGGGATRLVPVDHVVKEAPAWALDALISSRFRFLKTYDGDFTDSVVAPVLTRADDGRMHIRWRGDPIYIPGAVPPSHPRADDAAAWLHQLLVNADAHCRVLQRGDVIVVPNRIVVHGREPLSPSSPREILRAWAF